MAAYRILASISLFLPILISPLRVNIIRTLRPAGDTQDSMRPELRIGGSSDRWRCGLHDELRPHSPNDFSTGPRRQGPKSQLPKRRYGRGWLRKIRASTHVRIRIAKRIPSEQRSRRFAPCVSTSRYSQRVLFDQARMLTTRSPLISVPCGRTTFRSRVVVSGGPDADAPKRSSEVSAPLEFPASARFDPVASRRCGQAP
jgi:hypothetical protein